MPLRIFADQVLYVLRHPNALRLTELMITARALLNARDIEMFAKPKPKKNRRGEEEPPSFASECKL